VLHVACAFAAWRAHSRHEHVCGWEVSFSCYRSRGKLQEATFSALTHFAFRACLLDLTSSAAIPLAAVPTTVAPMTIASDSPPKWRGKEFLKLLPNADCDAPLMQTAPKTIPTALVANLPWLLRRCASFVSPATLGLCDNAVLLTKDPEPGFADHTYVTVADALLVGAALRQKTASQVLHQMLYGGVGDARGWQKVLNRLVKVSEPLQKIGRKSESYYSARSIDERLRASFIMDGKPYPKILTAVQQAALDAAALPETPGTLRYALTKGKSTE